jgi:hypothetical protein
MQSLRRFAVLALVLAAGSGAFGLPGRSQAQTSRFAFADTTLLRDTLGLKFDRLFETADSLGMLPDTLRAQVIRYRLPIHRLLVMSDSMHVAVDSVGTYIDRERFNPLSTNYATNGQASFKYRSGYNIGKTTTSWMNGADFLLQRGPMLLRNGTDITIDRTNSTAGLSLRNTRNSRSEATWRVSRNVSLGGVASLSGFDNTDPGSISNENERKGEYQFSSRTRQQERRGITSELNLLAGYLNLNNRSQIKRGFSGDLNGRARFERGAWFSHDLTAGINGNLSRTGRPTSLVTLGTHDLSGSVRGGLQLYQAAPVGLNVNYNARRTTVETPTEADTVNRILTSGAGVDGTLRLRLDNNRYLNLSSNLGTSTSISGDLDDQGYKAQGRWVQGAWQLDADIGNTIRLSKRPRRNGGGGYDEHNEDRLANGTLERPFGRRLSAKLSGTIGLSQSRSTVTADSASPPTPRDSYRQMYRIETIYLPAEVFSTTVALEVSLNRSINLPATSTSNNTDTRSYRAEWRWSYRMLRGLTVSQNNVVQSDYQFFPFSPERNDLSIDYSSVTLLSAIITPHLTVDVAHNARQRPHGDWRVLDDGSGVLLPSDENLSYTLRSQVVWTITQGVSLKLTPEYLATDRTGTTGGLETPTNSTRRLSLGGGVNLDIPLGKSGHLLGDISRQFSDDRSTVYRAGVPVPSPLAEQDYWSGSLGLTWDL